VGTVVPTLDRGSLSPASTRVAVAVTLVFVIAVGASWPTWVSLARAWLESATYSHGWLVAVVAAAWIAGRLRAAPQSAPATSSWLAWPALVFSVLLWLIAFKAHSSIGQQVVAPAIVWLSLATAFGPAFAARFLAPLAYLYLAIPIWDLLLPVLQRMASWFVERALAGIGVPAFIEGTFVYLPAGTFEVAEGCAGLRYLLVALSTAALLSAVRGFDAARTGLFLAFTAAVAVAMNWIRILIIVLAGHATGMQHYLVSREHVSFGWALFAVALGVVVFVGARSAASAPAAPRSPAPARPSLLARAAVVATLGLLPLAIALPPTGGVSRASGLALPRLSGTWEGPHPAASTWQPTFVGASASARAAYYSGARVVEVYVAEYATQERGRELVSSSNTFWQAEWAARDTGTGSFGLPSRQRTRVVDAPDGGRWVVTYFYSVGGLRTGSPVLAQLFYGASSWVRATPSRVAVAAYRCDEVCGDGALVVSDLLDSADYFDGLESH
jgi:EpsI family protein